MTRGASLLLASAWLMSAACASARPTPPPDSAPPPATPPAAAPEERPPYRIQPGDELGIKLFYHPSLNEDLVVRPDGRISLQLVDEIEAAGLTPAELLVLLEDRYSERLESPEVSVIVKTFAAERVFVAGEVGQPGVHALVGRTTVLQAISQAHGFKDTARLTQVVIIRRNQDSTGQVMVVDMTKVVDGSDLAGDILLRPYDVVWVPRSTIANVNKFIRQYIYNNIPVDFGIRLEVRP